MKEIVSITKAYPALVILLIIEGGSVMCAEIIVTHILSAYYGGSVYVWAGVLCSTLAGLAAGYFAGGRIASGKNNKLFIATLFLLALSLFLVPVVGDSVAGATLAIENQRTGILLSCFALLFPVLFFCGIVCPYAISMTSPREGAGFAAGLVYALSTCGGILFTFLIGLAFIPGIGVRYTCWLMALIFLLAATWLSISIRKSSFAEKHA